MNDTQTVSLSNITDRINCDDIFLPYDPPGCFQIFCANKEALIDFILKFNSLSVWVRYNIIENPDDVNLACKHCEKNRHDKECKECEKIDEDNFKVCQGLIPSFKKYNKGNEFLLENKKFLLYNRDSIEIINDYQYPIFVVYTHKVITVVEVNKLKENHIEWK